MNPPGSLIALLAADAIFLALSTYEAVLPEGGGIDASVNMDVELKSFGNCEDFPSMPMMFTDLQIAQVAKKKFAVNGGVEMNMTVNNEIMAAVTIMECEDSNSDDSCEFIASVRDSKFCDKITKAGTPWYEFVKDTDIGNKCPVSPGTYVFKESPLDFENAEGVQFTPGHWKIKMELFSDTFEGDAASMGKKPFGCNVVEVSVSPGKALEE